MSLLLSTPHSRLVVQLISSTMQHRPMTWQGQLLLLVTSDSSISCSDLAPIFSSVTRDSVA